MRGVELTNVLSVLSLQGSLGTIGCDQGVPYPGRESWSNTNAVDSAVCRDGLGMKKENVNYAQPRIESKKRKRENSEDDDDDDDEDDDDREAELNN